MAQMNKNIKANKESKDVFGMTITGKVRVWVKTFDDRKAYSVSVSSKDIKTGEYNKAYLPVIFSNACKPSADLEDGGYDITIKNAFPTVSKGKDGNKVAIMITDWE